MAAATVSLVVPSYNEERRLPRLTAALRDSVPRDLAHAGLELVEAIVVDDGSSDGTAAVLRKLEGDELPGLKVVVHPTNRGKSAAVRTGIKESRGAIVAIQDADLEYDPRDLPRLVAPIVEGHADVVYGSRLRGGRPQRAHLFWHYLGNRFLSLLTNVLYNTTISDMEVGHKAFRGDLIRSLPLVSEGFGFEPEVTAKILRRGDVRLYEIPVSYYGRTYAEGKKITWRDGVKAVALLLRFRFAR